VRVDENKTLMLEGAYDNVLTKCILTSFVKLMHSIS